MSQPLNWPVDRSGVGVAAPRESREAIGVAGVRQRFPPLRWRSAWVVVGGACGARA